MNLHAAKTYKKVDLESAPKDQILERLLDRVALDLSVARKALVENNIEAKANALGHAQRIIIELVAALDHAAAPALCANLARLYAYANARINDANLTLKTKPVDDAARVLASVADAFRQASGR